VPTKGTNRELKTAIDESSLGETKFHLSKQTENGLGHQGDQEGFPQKNAH